VEGKPLPNASDVLAIPLEQLLELRPMSVPCLRLFAFRYPVHLYWLAVRQGESPELPEPAESFVAMTRRNYRVRLHELSTAQYTLLGMLDGQQTLAQAFQQDSSLEIATVRDWLCDWADKGFFESLHFHEAGQGDSY